MTSQESPLALLERTLSQATRVIDGVGPTQAGDPTPCEGIDVRELIQHMLSETGRNAAAVCRQAPPGPTTLAVGEDWAGQFAETATVFARRLAPAGRSGAPVSFARWRSPGTELRRAATGRADGPCLGPGKGDPPGPGARFEPGAGGPADRGAPPAGRSPRRPIAVLGAGFDAGRRPGLRSPRRLPRPGARAVASRPLRLHRSASSRHRTVSAASPAGCPERELVPLFVIPSAARHRQPGWQPCRPPLRDCSWGLSPAQPKGSEHRYRGSPMQPAGW